jgi:anaerobic magnesium-protoporphyrin IX monomethyl ester cyclase
LRSRILIISTNREMAPQPTVPIGAAWVAEALHQSGFAVKFLDLCFVKNPLKAIDRVITSFNPDGIGLSIRNLDNCDFLAPKSFLPDVKLITDFLKSRTDARILLGGAGVSIMPMQVLEYLKLDHAVVGEGERAAVSFFRSPSSVHASVVPGVVCRRGEPKPHPCQDALAPGASVMPQMHNWVDAGKYLSYEPALPVQGKTGCAKRCLYCTYNRIEGEAWRMRDTGSVVEEISAAMRNTGAREFEFVDSIFNEPEGYLETLLEEILRCRLKLKLRVSSLSPKGLTKEQVRLMERAGMTSLVITPETVSGVTLAALKKDFTEDDIHHAAELISGSSIRALWCFLVGGPREDENTLAKTIDFVNMRIGKKDCTFLTTGVRIYPGTELHEMALRDGVVELADNLLMPRFYFSPQITPQITRTRLKQGLSHSSRCIFPSDTQSGSLGPLRRLGTMLGLPSPFWRYASYMNRITGRSRVISRNW